jgi:UDP-N-acetylglucosamine 1-carboxyvinyltransferase
MYIVNGGQPLFGEVSIRGAKNAGYKLMIASLLGTGTSKLRNIPDISDVRIVSSTIENLGASIKHLGNHTLEINPQGLSHSTIPFGIGQKSRASILFIGPLLSKFKTLKIPFPGGDKIGTRPIGRILDCLEKMGVQSNMKDNYFTLKAKKLVGTDYTFPKNSHTGTEIIIMTAVTAQGKTVLENAAQEPEVDDLIEFLNEMGANIKRVRPGTIHIQGVTKLGQAEHTCIPDRNETITFACAALATRGEVSILRVRPNTLTAFTDKLQQIGAYVDFGEDEILIKWTQPLKACDTHTTPHPGFMTDWGPLWTVLLTQTRGTSHFIERVFPNRFQQIPLLQQMGAKISFYNPEPKDPESFYNFDLENDHPEYFHAAKIIGPTKLKPIDITVSDLRAGATALIAALVADGKSSIRGVNYIRRGYENLDTRLKSLGANIKYIKTARE